MLFRTNAQSRPFEEELLRANMPYSVVGGVKFYERAEIKDILSFLRLAVRPHDTPSIERVINVPSRGIGDTTTKALDDEAQRVNASLWTVIEGDLAFLPPRAAKAVREFRDIVRDLQRAATNPLPELLDYVLLRTGYRRMLAESRDVQDESRLQNIDEPRPAFLRVGEMVQHTGAEDRVEAASEIGNAVEVEPPEFDVLEPEAQTGVISWRIRLVDPLRTPNMHVRVTGMVVKER